MWINDGTGVVGAHERVYYLRAGESGLLVDCGSDATYGSNMDQLEREGVDLDSVAAILVSHEHYDHIAGIGKAKAQLGCPVIAHKLAVEAVETGDPLLTACEMRFHGVNVPFHATTVDAVVEEGDRITLGDLEVKVFHIPGHTPGGTAYLVGGSLFVGDTFFADGGIGWGDVHWGSCLKDHVDSMEKIAGISATTVLPGHGNHFAHNREVIDLALQKLEWLDKIGVPSKNTQPAPRRPSGEEGRTVSLPP
jgi:glyoxylase-like metal-dependent hydrolase (beta-lactamase superfamily II)